MKTLFIFFFCCFSIVASAQLPSQAHYKGKPKPEPTTIIKLVDFKHLVPLEIVDSTTTNDFEKYGLDLSGNCYACDLAEITVTMKKKMGEIQVDFINVCDDSSLFRVFGYDDILSETALTITSKYYTFVFTQISNAPIFELTVTGKNFVQEKRKLVKYYTPKKILPKFKVHDCGDFGG